MALTMTEILRRNRQAAQKAVEEVGAAKLRKVLERAQRDLEERLRHVEGLKGAGAGSFSAAQARTVLRQIEDVLRHVKAGMRGVAVEQAIHASERQTASVLKYLTDAEKLFTGVATPLGISDAAVYDHVRQGAESSVLRRIASDPAHPGQRGVLDRYGDQVIESFETELQQRVLQQAPWEEVRSNLVKASPFLQKAPAHWAERIIRTESMAASNRASFEAIQASEAALGDVVKILSAVFDGRTGSDSYDVHGQIRRPNERFTDWFGRSYMHPPNRPNDREVVVPHRIAWPIPPALKPKSDGECAAAWAREGRKGAMPSRSKHSTVDLSLFGKPPAGAAPAVAPTASPAPKPPPPPPPPPPVVVGRQRDVEPVVQLQRDARGKATFHRPDGREVRLTESMRRATETLLDRHSSDHDLGRWLTGGAAPQVEATRPYEADLARTLGKIDDAIKKRGRSKGMRLDDVQRLTFETQAPNREVAARLAAQASVGEPTVVKWGGKYYVRDGGEHLAAQVALTKASDPHATHVLVKLVDLDKEQRPSRPAKDWASSNQTRFRELGQGTAGKEVAAAAREDLRELLRHHGVATRDDEPDPTALTFDTNAGVLQTMPHIPGANGYHDWQGRIVVRDEVAKGAAQAIGAIAKYGTDLAKQPTSVQNALLQRLNTFVHEEAHGASPIESTAYQGAGVGMEEAATEILSRKVTRELVGHTSPTGRVALGLPTRKPDGGYRAEPGDVAPWFGSYNGYIGTLLRETGEVVGHDGVHEKVEQAIVKTRSSEERRRYKTDREHIAAYATALGLKGAKHAKLVERLMQEFPKTP